MEEQRILGIGYRTGIKFHDHILTIDKESDNTITYHLKKPDTITNNIKFINTNGLLVVTGDFGNWVFCRDFHPNSNQEYE